MYLLAGTMGIYGSSVLCNGHCWLGHSVRLRARVRACVCAYACVMASREDRVDKLDMMVTDSEGSVPGGGVN